MTGEVLLFAAFGVLCIGACAHSTWEAWAWLRFLRRRRIKNGRRMTATSNLLLHGMLTAAVAVFASPAAVVMFELMPPGESRSHVIVWMLVTAMGLFTAAAMGYRVTQMRLRRYYEDKPIGEH